MTTQTKSPDKQQFSQASWIRDIPLLGVLGRGGAGVSNAQFEQAMGDAAQSLETVKPDISVIMPVLNRASVVTGAIQSILDQLYAAHEIIVCDDGSTDDTVATIQAAFPAQIESGLLHIIQSEINHGTAHARNRALEVVNGDLVAYLDSDNTWREHYLFMMAALFCQAPQLDCAYAGMQVDNRDEHKVFTLAKPYDRKTLLEGNYIDMNIFMHRTRLYHELGGFDESIERLEDWDLVIRYTSHQAPPLLPGIGADYLIDTRGLANKTTTTTLDDKIKSIHNKHSAERRAFGLD